MYPTFSQSSLCNIPAFFYPTTILLVDDDEHFLKNIAIKLKKYYKTVTFTDSNQAIEFLTQKEGGSFFRGRALSRKVDDGVLGFRQELSNRHRFEDVLVSVLDYDMPDKSGFDVWMQAGLSDYQNSHEHSYILLTAKRYAELEKKIANEPVGKNFISKHDPKYMDYLLESINTLSARMFQGISHGIANHLNHEEKTSFLNDGNFLSILNSYLKEHDICEGYLFDRQGSLLMGVTADVKLVMDTITV